MRTLFLTLTIATGLILQGCGSVVIPTAMKLNAISPLTADPAGFEIAATLPEDVAIPDSGAVLGFEMSRIGPDEIVTKEYILQRRQARDGQLLFRVDPSDLDDMRDFQALAAQWKSDEDRTTTGSFTVNVTGCALDETVNPDGVFSIAIKTMADGAFLPLIRDAKVSDILDKLDATEESPLCD